MICSIIIINYNTFELTCSCIKSIINGLKRSDYEIILVDNASISQQTDNFEMLFPTIQLIKSEKNLGFAGGNNLGIAQAKGKYILLLNSDTEFISDSLSKAIDYLDYNPNVGVLSAMLIYPDRRLQHPVGNFASLNFQIRELCRINKFFGYPESIKKVQNFDYSQTASVDWVWGTYFLTRKSIIEQLPQGKLAQDFFMYYEDVQWCYQIKKLGYQIVYFPQVCVVHHIGKSSNRDYASCQIESNEHLFIKKYKPLGYSFLYYLTKSALYASFFNKKDFQIAKRLFALAFKQ